MTPLPPGLRSQAARMATVAALSGEFLLQRCRECGVRSWPPAELCNHCLGNELLWEATESGATLLAVTPIHRSFEPYFQMHTPWPIGLAKLDAGPVAMVHLAGPGSAGERVLLVHRLDASGSAVLVAGDGRDPWPFSRNREDLRTLATPDPHGAATQVREALAVTGCEGVLLAAVGNAIRVTARYHGRLLRLDLHEMEA